MGVGGGVRVLLVFIFFYLFDTCYQKGTFTAKLPTGKIKSVANYYLILLIKVIQSFNDESRQVFDKYSGGQLWNNLLSFSEPKGQHFPLKMVTKYGSFPASAIAFTYHEDMICFKPSVMRFKNKNTTNKCTLVNNYYNFWTISSAEYNPHLGKITGTRFSVHCISRSFV